MKLDSPKASRVIHFRGVPSDATESEIVQLGLPFGRMTNLVLARKKNQVCVCDWWMDDDDTRGAADLGFIEKYCYYGWVTNW